MPRRAGELTIAGLLLAIACGVGLTAIGMPMGTANLPGAGVFPLALAAVLGAAACALVVGALRLPREPADAVVVGHPRIALSLVALCSVAVLLERLGFVVSIATMMTVLLRSFSALRWWQAAAGAIAATVAAHLFFEYALGVHLPRGLLL